jgi:hypothetical protein
LLPIAIFVLESESDQPLTLAFVVLITLNRIVLLAVTVEARTHVMEVDAVLLLFPACIMSPGAACTGREKNEKNIKTSMAVDRAFLKYKRKPVHHVLLYLRN